MKKQKISDAVIHRLPRYYRYLDDLYNKGVVRISSSSLGSKMDITASQIRQDLSCFGEFGQQGYGYNVAELRAEIGHILGIDNGHRLIIIGAGHLGHALLQNFDFEKVGFQVDSAFDVSPALIDTQIRGVTIRAMDQLADYVARYQPNVAVLTVPQNVAQPLADQLIGLGIRGFWNFTNVELSTDVPGVFFEDVHFVDTLLTEDSTTRIALVVYNLTETHTGFYTYENKAALKSKINAIEQDNDNGGTFTQLGLHTARTLLNSAESTGQNKSIVLLSDGEPTKAYEFVAVNATYTNCQSSHGLVF